ncbi:MAG: PAS domain S-box protein, partial [Bacteroidales bacterium]|nr:PAS domain S-box protein [Bacteroidales bacterium]
MEIVLISSIAFQLIAVFIAIRLIYITKKYFAWILIALAISLMAIRRLITLISILQGSKVVSGASTAEYVALTISILLAAGLFFMIPIFTSIRKHKKQLEEKNKALEIAQEIAEENKEKYQIIADYIYNWEYWISKDGKLNYISPSCERITGYSANEFTQDPTLINRIIHPSDIEIFKDHTHLTSESGEIIPIEFRIITKNQEERWIEHICHDIYDGKGVDIGLRSTNIDITEQKTAKLVIQKSEERFRKLIDTMPSGLAIYLPVNNGDDFRFVDINKEAEKITNSTKKELIGHTLLEKFPNMKDGHLIKSLKKVHKDGLTAYLPPFFYKDNQREGWRENHIYKLNSGEIVAIFRDVTKLKSTENRLNEQNIELMQAREKAEESNRLKTAFLNNISHEIRTPLNGILGFLEFVIDPDFDTEEKNELIKAINTSSKRLVNTITDIINIAQIESSRLTANINELSLNDLLKEIYQSFSIESEMGNIIFSYNLGLPNKEVRIFTDRDKLLGTLTNLIKNAFKFTEKGEITFGYTLKNNVLEFFVKDTGIGIPENRQEAIFDKFVQADIGDSRAFQGVGVGLSIAKAYVESLGGELWLNSKEDIGSEFYFTIPYKTTDKQSTKKSFDKTKREYSNLTVLIAEDDEITNQYFETIFKDLFREIIFVKTGQQAID